MPIKLDSYHDGADGRRVDHQRGGPCRPRAADGARHSPRSGLRANSTHAPARPRPRSRAAAWRARASSPGSERSTISNRTGADEVLASDTCGATRQRRSAKESPRHGPLSRLQQAHDSAQCPRGQDSPFALPQEARRAGRDGAALPPQRAHRRDPPARAGPTKRRPIGLGEASFQLSPRFFEPLPDAVVEAFRGAGR